MIHFITFTWNWNKMKQSCRIQSGWVTGAQKFWTSCAGSPIPSGNVSVWREVLPLWEDPWGRGLQHEKSKSSEDETSRPGNRPRLDPATGTRTFAFSHETKFDKMAKINISRWFCSSSKICFIFWITDVFPKFSEICLLIYKTETLGA